MRTNCSFVGKDKKTGEIVGVAFGFDFARYTPNSKILDERSYHIRGIFNNAIRNALSNLNINAETRYLFGSRAVCQKKIQLRGL